MNPQTIVVRFDQVAEQSAGPVLRITGFVKARELIQLLDAADLDANPRSAKSGPVTEDILESIGDTPEIFMFKTKGILIGASFYEKLQRNRYRLSFENPKIEGILDGGHNTLAIGTHILMSALNSNSIKRQIRRWPDFKEAWEEYRDEVEALRKLKPEDDGYTENALDFLVPVEILVPSDPEDEDVLEAFNSSLLAICSARNNNVQLTLETKANKKGFYEDLRNALPTEISNRVEWKTNDGGEIKARDIIALSWIPMSLLDHDFVPEIPPQNIYRNKGECAKLFDELMSDDDVSEATGGEYTRQVHNQSVRSALLIAAQIPALYDKIYKDFPAAYNENNGRFGKISIVKMADEMRSVPTSYFTRQPVNYRYPDGLIMPIVYGLKALMKVDEDGTVSWSQDPYDFLDNHLAAIVKKYKVILDAYGFDPQKVGKSEGSYELVVDAFRTELMLQTA
ncbi:AIPR family protein [Stutzerimonas nitrititolerans]|uniref:AIPR family protein n=1 Tax=Stutzerimonas nitrititolerans TaxID=2482751 RepID=UPI0028AF742C|nr:AIPR family protein [Stutzerimonas nitrititolerans]